MKTMTLFVIVALLSCAAPLRAEEASATDVQTRLLAAATDTAPSEAAVEIQITLPDFESVHPIVFNETVPLNIVEKEGSFLVLTDEFPIFSAELSQVPESFKPLTLELMLKSTAIKITKESDGGFQISSVDIAATVHKKGQRMASFVMAGIEPRLEASENGDIRVSFTSKLPASDNDIFNSVLAGKRIEGIAYIELK